jgi:endonuclease III related protein
LLNYGGLRGMTAEQIAPVIRSCGTFNVKARRLAAFVDFLGRRHSGRVENMGREEPWKLRRQLLAVPGIGRETADCIALYAAGHPLFVVDGYTRRVFSRLGLIRGDESYDDVQRFLMRRLPRDSSLFNDYHAQIVGLAKQSCRARPLCGECPLDDVCPKRGVA